MEHDGAVTTPADGPVPDATEPASEPLGGGLRPSGRSTSRMRQTVGDMVRSMAVVLAVVVVIVVLAWRPWPEAVKVVDTGPVVAQAVAGAEFPVLAPQGLKIVAYADQEQVYADLLAGRLHASLQDAQQAQIGFLRSPQGEGFILGPLIESELMPNKSAIGVAKGNRALKTLLDKGLVTLHAEGIYSQLQERYFPGVNMFSGQ